MYILMVSRGYPTTNDPQWGCFEKDQAEALAAYGHKVVVVSVDRRFRFRWRKLGCERKQINNIPYYNYFLLPSAIASLFIGRERDLLVSERQFRRVFRQVVQEQGMPDIIYGQFFWNTLRALPVAKEEHIPIVGIEHWSRFNRCKEEIDAFTYKNAGKVYRSIDRALVVSESLKGRMQALFGGEYEVVHNLVGNEFANAYVPAPIYSKDNTKKSEVLPFTFISCGSLVHRKGFDLLIEACRGLRIPNDAWQLNIIGGGELQESLQEQVNAAGLQTHIHLLGTKTKEDIVALLQQSHAFVLASRSENFSVAVLEAMVCGLPVVASICGGIRECIVEHKNGLLFPVEDVAALRQAMQDIYDHYAQYNRKAIAEDAIARFGGHAIAQQLTTIFDETIKTHIS